MSLRKLLFLTFLFSLSLSSFAQGIEFFHGTWEEALVKSETEGKLIFVDAYTTWCGPCKKMSANVFPAAEVGEVFNANFINVKLDMEKAESVSFRRVHSVRAYPTLFWINGKDEVVHTSVGGKQVASLITVANAASPNRTISKPSPQSGKQETATLSSPLPTSAPSCAAKNRT
jgi:thiol-disulfide isomerase/thioredoxin